MSRIERSTSPTSSEWFPPYFSVDHAGRPLEQSREFPVLFHKLLDVYHGVIKRSEGTYFVLRRPVITRGLTIYSDAERQIDALLAQPEEDDLGRACPSPRAVKFAKFCLYRLATEGFPLPMPDDVSTDHEGGIRISWERGGKFVELVVPYHQNDQPFIYNSDGPRFGLVYSPDGKELRQWLNWLNR